MNSSFLLFVTDKMLRMIVANEMQPLFLSLSSVLSTNQSSTTRPSDRPESAAACSRNVLVYLPQLACAPVTVHHSEFSTCLSNLINRVLYRACATVNSTKNQFPFSCFAGPHHTTCAV